MKSFGVLLVALLAISTVHVQAGTTYTVHPSVISELGGIVTVTASEPFGIDPPFLISGPHGFEYPEVVSVNGSVAILKVGPNSGKVQLAVTLDDTIELRFTEPSVTTSHNVYPTSAQFLTIHGANFNPHNIHVTLSQTTPAGHRKRVMSQKETTTTVKYDCVIVDATATRIVCAVMDLKAGPITATITTNNVAATAFGQTQVIAVIKDAGDGSWSQYSSATNGVCVPPNGTPDPFITNQCNCYSGYAPSTATGTDCNVRAKCAEMLLDQEDSVAGNNAPHRPTTSFSDDKLHIVQQVPIVLSRHAFWTSFQVPKLNNTLPLSEAGSEGAETCNYPGILWTKTVSQLDCVDIYTAAMPWVQNQFCGFVQDLDATTPSFAVYKSVMVNEFLEVYHVAGSKFQRLSRYSYLVTVQFATRKVFSSESLSVNIADSTAPNFVQVRLLSDAVYDVASGNVLVVFRTTTAWPYMLTVADNGVGAGPAYAATAANIAGVTVDITDVDYAAGVSCDNTQDSECSQGWYARVNTNGKCNIAGVYTFNDLVVCRDTNSSGGVIACPTAYSQVSFSINIKKTDLCDAAPISATEKLKVTVTPFFDQDLSNQVDSYQTGDMIYWRVDVTNPQATIEKVEFERIVIETDSSSGTTTEDVIYDQQALTSVGNSANLNITNVDYEVSPGKTGSLTFNHMLLRSALVNTVGQLGNTIPEVVLSTTITINLYYHGNQKRTAELQISPSASVTQSYKIQVVENPNKSAPSLDVDASALAGAAAPSSPSFLVSVLLVLVVVAQVFLF